MKEIHNKSGEKKDNADELTNGGAESNTVLETSRMPFLMLGLDLPPPPLFQDVMEKNIIPQVLNLF